MQNSTSICLDDSKQQNLSDLLFSRYDFRFNVLTEMPEFKRKCETAYRMVDKRAMNSLCIEALNEDLKCSDRDVSRLLFSEQIPSHHPFGDYMAKLPEWDGIDRITMMAARVSGNGMWLNAFHRWMLGMAAQWLGYPSRCANAFAPLLISTEQGMCKSTFCSILLPEELRNYYIDKFDITSTSGCEQKLSTFGLINMDEFDRYSEKKMATLKNLMQMKRLNFRKCFRAYYSTLPRIASFIGTSNEKSLLTDVSGSRRFLCIEVEKPIDCSTPEYEQMYAQLKWELENGKRYWLSKEEEEEIQQHNKAFYKHSPEEEAFFKVFRLPKEGEECVQMTATDIFNVLQKRFPAVMRGSKVRNIGSILTKMGAKRIHTRYGNYYSVRGVKDVKEGENTCPSQALTNNQTLMSA